MTARSPHAALARRLRALAAVLSAGEMPESLRREMEAALARWEALLGGGAADEPGGHGAPAPRGAAGRTGRAQAQMTLGTEPGGAATGTALPGGQGESPRQAGRHDGDAPGLGAASAGQGSDRGGNIRIWGDGSCAPNPGPGGWGAIIDWGNRREELCGAEPRSTNNIMELTAMIQSLRHTAPGSRVHMSTDSQYVKNGITQWIHAWKRKGWRKADGQPVLNQELWRALDGLCAERRVQWTWVRGHSGHPENERCDELANEARLSLSGSR